MQTSSFVNREDAPPGCFGKEWDKNESECAGGPDASFIPKADEAYDGVDERGAYIRKQCLWYQRCGARVAATKNAQGTLIPAQNLARPHAPPPPPPQPQVMAPQNFQQWLAAQPPRQVQVTPPPVQPQRPPAPQVPQQPYPGQVHYAQPMYQQQVMPATNWQLNYASPPFLSEPEIRYPGESIWPVLFRETMRSMGKAVGHAVAHAFDSRRLKE